MITAMVLFFLTSLVALDVARRHEIGRSTSRLRIPGNNATAPATATHAPASDQRSRPVAIGPVQAGEPRRPARGDPTKMTSPRGMQEDHVGAHRAFHEITVDADPANPGQVAGADPQTRRGPANRNLGDRAGVAHPPPAPHMPAPGAPVVWDVRAS